MAFGNLPDLLWIAPSGTTSIPAATMIAAFIDKVGGIERSDDRRRHPETHQMIAAMRACASPAPPYLPTLDAGFCVRPPSSLKAPLPVLNQGVPQVSVSPILDILE